MFYGWDDLLEGQAFSKEFHVTPDIYSFYVNTLGDSSPIHTDQAFARKNGYPDMLMHGAILNGFLACFTGMHFPGPAGMTLSVDFRYQSPFFLSDSLVFAGKIVQRSAAHRVLVLDVAVLRESRKIAVARVQTKILRE